MNFKVLNLYFSIHHGFRFYCAAENGNVAFFSPFYRNKTRFERHINDLLIRINRIESFTVSVPGAFRRLTRR
jgi:hypothetical protein